MARGVVASAAYLGDVAPYVRPANLLADRGHDVTFVAPVGFHDLLRGERFRLAPYPLDFSAPAMQADPEHERLMRHPFANFPRLARYWMRKGMVDDLVATRASLLEALEGADALVTHPTFGTASLPVAQHLGIPAVVGHLFPMTMPTAEWVPAVSPRLRSIGRAGNRSAWAAFTGLSGAALYDRQINRYRASLGVRPLRGNAAVAWTEAVRTVLLVSRHYLGRSAADWEHVTWGGFSPWPGPARAIDPAVEAFIGAGDPPVLVCLGTSAASGARAAFAEIGSALDGLGLRSLLLVGHEPNLAAVCERPGAFTFAPVPSVLPRCRAAVISGSLGTMAAALTAGVPVVIVPQLFDQVWHGKRVESLGVGRMARSPRGVAKAVAAIEADPSYRERARRLGAQLAAEDGGVALADAVEQVLAGA